MSGRQDGLDPALLAPFATTALQYRRTTDIGSPIPVWYPGGTKAPLAKGCTGYSGVDADEAKLGAWARKYKKAAIGLRLARSVVGIDVDLYNGKAGAFTIGVLQRKWGVLPDTWSTTSRSDGSGIYLFRVPDGVDTGLFRDPRGVAKGAGGEVFGGVEIVRHGHRYAMVGPSRHPRSGRPEYRWMEGDEEADRIPLCADLGTLPSAWCEGLGSGWESGGASWGGAGTGGYVLGDDTEPASWLKERPDGAGEPCQGLSGTVARAIQGVREGSRNGSCYSAVLTGVFQIIGDAAEGCRGAYTAVAQLSGEYRAAMRENRRRSEREVKLEFRRCLVDAIRKRPMPYGTEDPCLLIGAMQNWLVEK